MSEIVLDSITSGKRSHKLSFRNFHFAEEFYDYFLLFTAFSPKQEAESSKLCVESHERILAVRW